MINGLNPNTLYPSQSGSAAVRERSDVARNPAASPEKSDTGVAETLARPQADANSGRTGALTDELLQRRVEARQAADDARLERFSPNELPLATSRALSTFAEVASQRDGHDVELAGIDIRI